MYCTKLVVCGRLVSYTHTDLACSSLTREPDWGHSCIPCLNTCDPAQLCRGGGLENVIVWLLQKHSQNTVTEINCFASEICDFVMSSLNWADKSNVFVA